MKHEITTFLVHENEPVDRWPQYTHIPTYFAVDYSVNVWPVLPLVYFVMRTEPKHINICHSTVLLKVDTSGLRSCSKGLLVECLAKTQWGTRSFMIGAAKLWNSLPYSLKSSNNLLTFKSKLKTYLFNEAFA